MARTELQATREKRAENMLALKLWEVIGEEQNKRSTKTEAKLTRLSVVKVLLSMVQRIVEEQRDS